MKYVLIAPGPGQGRFIMELNDDVMVVAAPDGTRTRDMIHDPADVTHLAIIPLIEQLEWAGDDEGPDADTVEAAGLDSTLRTKPDGLPHTWQDVAQALLAQKKERRVQLDRATVKRLRKLQRHVDDTSHTMMGAVLYIAGVWLQVGESE